ncbi:ABC transporter ATP-binding protein [Haladaptatus sp. NG-WS-4]
MESAPVRTLLFRFVRPHARSLVGGIALLFGAMTLSRVPPLLIGVTLDSLLLDSEPFSIPLIPSTWLPATTTGQVVFTVAGLGVAIVGETAAQWYGRWVYERATLETLHDVRTTVFATATRLPVDTGGDTDRLSVLHDDTGNLTRLFGGIRDGVRYGGNVLTAFAFMALLNWNLALVLLVLPLVIAATGRVYARLLGPRYDRVRGSVGGLNARLRDAIEGQATVKACTREATERDRVAAASGEYRQATWTALKLRAVYNRVSWVIAATGIWGLFAFGSYWILVGPPWGLSLGLTAGTLLTFILYTFSFLDPTRRLAVDVVDAVQDGRASARRVIALLAAPEDAEFSPEAGDTGGTDWLAVDGRISYDDVSFTYPDAESPALDGVSFDVPGGAFVGVVGPSGAGKSTLCSLLLRFDEPDAGTIRLDGRPIESAAVRDVRSHIGYVSQEPHLFPGSVRENIAYARPDAADAAVREAARLAGAHEFVTDLPDGYDTEVGEGGATLSGGQRQRLALARALLPDPDVLVLDEATSHVDQRTGLAIQRRLPDLAGDRTVLAVSHQLPSVRHADRLLVLDDGRLVETGTHAELVDRDGTYAGLWAVQTGELVADSASRSAGSVSEVAE